MDRLIDRWIDRGRETRYIETNHKENKTDGRRWAERQERCLWGAPYPRLCVATWGGLVPCLRGLGDPRRSWFEATGSHLYRDISVAALGRQTAATWPSDFAGGLRLWNPTREGDLA